MKFTEASLQGVFVIEPSAFVDDRGWFARTFCQTEFSQIGFTKQWLQMNHSYTRSKGSIRGMHYQNPPHAEIKLVRCIVGSVHDVVIDVREGSETFLQSFSIELSSANQKMLYIPEGFAHGFQTVSDDAELVYCHSNLYTPGFEAAIRYNDPALNINWPLPVTVISEKDQQHPSLENHFKGIKL